MCYHAQLVRTLKSVVIDTGEHPKLGSAESPPLWDLGMSDPLKQATRTESAKLVSAGPRPRGVEAWLTHKNKPTLHMFYHVKFGSSASKVVRINRREPPNWGALGSRPLAFGAWLTLEIRPSRRVLSCRIWSF